LIKEDRIRDSDEVDYVNPFIRNPDPGLNQDSENWRERFYAPALRSIIERFTSGSVRLKNLTMVSWCGHLGTLLLFMPATGLINKTYELKKCVLILFEDCC
jgi:hypothetical protein